jgi:hypothetical protein
MMNTQLMARYAELNKRKAALEAELRKTKDMMAPMEQEVLDELNRNEVERVTVDGVTFYTRRDITVAATQGTGPLVDALDTMGLRDMLGANWSRLKSWAKEQCYREDVDDWIPDVKRLPEPLHDLVRVDERISLGLRNSR